MSAPAEREKQDLLNSVALELHCIPSITCSSNTEEFDVSNVFTIFTAFYLFTMTAANVSAQSLELPAYKDELFNYSATLETRDGGAFELKDFEEMRDVNGRDEIPVKKAQAKYVDESIIGSERAETLKAGPVKVDYLAAGATSDAAFAVIFAHGSNGTKDLGMQDWTFGGNFNRLKHFAINNNGTYYSPSFLDFGKVGAAQIKLLVQKVRAVSPKAKIVLACASSGGSICESAFFQPENLANVSGFVLMATGVGPKMLASAEIKSYGGAIFLLHGTNDKLVRYERHYEAFSRFKSARTDFAIRFQLFQTGGHGTPIRMIDWRDTLNWIFSSTR